VDVNSFPRKVYVMPPNSCPGAGLGTIGTVQSSRAWIFACDLKGVFAHEIGHNLGMDHASTPSDEYGDGTDPMSMGTWMLHGVNAPHRVALGWLAAADTVQVSESGVYEVAPLAADPSAATAPRTILIPKADTHEYYYLSYRTPLGFDNYIDGSYYYRLSVHRYASDGSLARTFLVAGLADGESFVDAVNGITITQISHDATHSTTRVEIAAACVPASPAVSVAPALQSAPAGSSLSYQVSITNRETAACAVSAFSLTDAVPTGWSATMAPASLALGPGETGYALLTVTSASGAAVGTYSATIRASTSGTSETSSAVATYAIQLPRDDSAPTAPSNLTAVVNQKKKQIALGWKAATDNVGVVGYRVWRNGVSVATSATTGWVDQAWSGGASYTYAVTAFDAAGNVSPAGNSVSITLPGGGKKP